VVVAQLTSAHGSRGPSMPGAALAAPVRCPALPQAHRCRACSLPPPRRPLQPLSFGGRGSMSSSARGLQRQPSQYGSACAARAAPDGDGAGTAAVEEAAASGGISNGYGATVAAPIGERGADELPLAGGSVDIDASSICDQEECPFPSHHAFDAKQPQQRLRNQASFLSLKFAVYGHTRRGNMRRQVMRLLSTAGLNLVVLSRIALRTLHVPAAAAWWHRVRFFFTAHA